MNSRRNILNHSIVFFTLLFFSLYLRYFSWSTSTIDWDESTYLIMGEAILRGFTPYKDFWDLKPMGIFYLNSLFISLWGYTIFAVRISSFLFTTCTSFAIYLLIKKYSKILGVLGGMSLVVFFINFPQGLSGNTEIYFLAFETMGIYFFFSKSKYRTFLGAVLLGLAFLVKYIIIFDLIFFYSIKYLLNIYPKKSEPITRLHFINSTKTIFVLGLFSLVPLALTGLHFLFIYDWHYFISSLTSVLQKHKNETPVPARLKFLFSFLNTYLFLFSILFTGIFISRNTNKIFKNRLFLISSGWLFTSSLGSIWTGFLYDHYLLSIVPSICILLFILLKVLLHSTSLKLKRYNSITNNTLFNFYLKSNLYIYIILFLYILNSGFKSRTQLIKILNNLEDYPTLISNHITKKGGGNVFVSSGYHATYILLNQLPPIKYIQPNNYGETIFPKNFEIKLDELNFILKNDIKFIQWCDNFSPSDVLNRVGIDKEKYFLPFYDLISNIIISDFLEDDFVSKSCKIYTRR